MVPQVFGGEKSENDENFSVGVLRHMQHDFAINFLFFFELLAISIPEVPEKFWLKCYANLRTGSEKYEKFESEVRFPLYLPAR